MVMEIFTLLEHRVNDLLQQMDTLRVQNRALYDAASHADALQQENRRLEAELEKERQLNKAVEERISGLLQQLDGHLDTSKE